MYGGIKLCRIWLSLIDYFDNPATNRLIYKYLNIPFEQVEIPIDDTFRPNESPSRFWKRRKRPKEQVTAFSHACIAAAEMIVAEGAALRVIGNTKSSCFPSALLPYTETKENSLRKAHRHNPLLYLILFFVPIVCFRPV